MVVSKYRYRGNIPYKQNLPGHPDFDATLKTYEDAARNYPSTRPYLHPKILAMRAQSAEKTANQEAHAALPKIVISGNEYLSPKYKTIEGGKLIIIHKDGVAKIEIDDVTDSELQSLAKIDPAASQIKVVKISSKRIWNPSFVSLASNKINIKHGKGVLSLGFDQMSKDEKAEIMSWSDGSWKIEKPGFYSLNLGSKTYGEIVLESGKFHTDVHLVERNGVTVTVKTSKSALKIPIRELATIPGLSADDSSRIDGWAKEIVEERLAHATPVESSEILSFKKADVLRVTDVRVLILQVLDEGVLASKFVGKLHKGTNTVKTTKTVTAEHPVTGKKISKILDESTDDYEFVEDVNDDLCYIVGNTSNLVDGEIVKADSMKLLGRFQYTDVRGAERSVRKYHVD